MGQSYKVNKTDLTSIADKLRTASSTTSSLAWPQGFENVIDNLPTQNLDNIQFGDNPKVDEKGITSSEYYEAIAEAINAAKTRPVISVEPVTVIENGVKTPEAGKAFGTITTNVPNPNYIKIIEGTMSNPFGDYEISEIIEQAVRNDITLLMQFDASAVIPGTRGTISCLPIDSESNPFIKFTGFNTSGSNYLGLGIIYFSSGLKLAQLFDFNLSSGTGTITDMTDYMDLVTTMLAIIHHPLSDSLPNADTATFGGTLE